MATRKIGDRVGAVLKTDDNTGWLLRYATGLNLDFLGQMLGIARLQASDVSSTTLDNNFEFYIARGTFGTIINGQGVTIPAGTQIYAVQSIAGQVALTATAVTCQASRSSAPFAVTNLSVYSWMKGATVATTPAVGGAAMVAGLSYAGGAMSTAAAGTGLVATTTAATTEWASGLDHPWALRDRGCRHRRLVVHREHSQAEPRRDRPCTKFGRPWVGGIEGWSINDLVGVVNNKAMQFVADKIFPLIDAWKAFHGYPTQIPPTPQPSWGLSTP